MNTKKLAFEYFLCELIKWDMEARSLSDFNKNNDLSILKALKLLFFTVAVDAKDENSLLENIFDNFHAMPLGHVELDIYNQYTDLKYFQIDRKSVQLKNISWNDVQASFNAENIDLSNFQKSKIKTAISELKSRRFNLILEKAFNLVELSHTWNSWISTFNSSFSKVAYIRPDLIRNDFQNFEIQSF